MPNAGHAEAVSVLLCSRLPAQRALWGLPGRWAIPKSVLLRVMSFHVTQEVLDLWPNSGTVRVADVAALADRWQRRWPSARHASPAALLTVANMRHLLLDALWKQLPAVTEAEQHDRGVPSLRRQPYMNMLP